MSPEENRMAIRVQTNEVGRSSRARVPAKKDGIIVPEGIRP